MSKQPPSTRTYVEYTCPWCYDPRGDVAEFTVRPDGTRPHYQTSGYVVQPCENPKCGKLVRVRVTIKRMHGETVTVRSK